MVIEEESSAGRLLPELWTLPRNNHHDEHYHEEMCFAFSSTEQKENAFQTARCDAD
jgi:hypothetical protein